MGFTQYNKLKNTRLPQVLGVQAEGAAPLVLGYPIEKPETIATAIRIGKPARGEEALAVAHNSNGMIISTTDEEILAAQKLLAASGIWVEPASAAGIAGLKNKIKEWMTDLNGKQIVAVCTGHGLKDPDIITEEFTQPKTLPADFTALEKEVLHG